MADRKPNTSHKQSPRSNLQGLSLTDFGTNFNFGPTLVPTSASPSALRNQPEPPDVSSSTKATAELEKYAEEDSFLGQHPQKYAQAPQQSGAKSEGNPEGSAFFTMTSSADFHDDFLTPETSTQSSTDFQVSSSRTAGSYTPPRPSNNQPSEPSHSPQRPVIGGSFATSQSTGLVQSLSQPQTPPHPATGWPQTPPRPATGWPQTPPRPTTGWPETPPQPGTGLPQTPPQHRTGLPQTPPRPATGWPQTPPQPVSSWSQNPSTASLSSLETNQPPSQPTYSQSPQEGSRFPQQVPSGSIPAAVPNASIEPSKPHWFYCKGGSNWIPFSYIDSDSLEQALRMPATNGDRIVATDGGRYDVNLDKRLRYPLYWEESVSVVRRCTWFCKGDGKAKLIPYVEDMAQRLEAEFQLAFRENKWPRRLDLKEGEHIIMHNTNVMVHFCPTNENESWSGEDIVARPKVVRRGVADIEDEIEDGEPAQIDHLVFVVHGIGPIADLNFRNIIECVDDLRKVSLQMLFDHHEELSKGRAIGRVEFLPVQWHSRLHNDSTGVDKRLQSISLGSIHRLREFTNSTLLDILFYTSPTYCQTIVNTVGDEIKRLLGIFKKRNPMFNGQYSVCGHSLGSSILFDILLHQKDPRVSSPSTKHISETSQTKAPSDAEPEKGVKSTPVTGKESNQGSDDEEDGPYPLLSDALTQLGLPEYVGVFESEEMDMETFLVCSENDIKEMGIPMGPRKKLIGYMAKQRQVMEKKKLEREERRQARAAAKAKARAEQQEKELQSTTENAPKSSEPELTSSTMLMKSDLGIHKSVTSLASVESVEVVYQQGLAGTGQPYVEYPQLDLNLYALFALGSPIGMFLTVRGVDEIGLNFQLPTCPRLFNIFHPFDPVAYRIEPLVNQAVTEDPVLMPHHKGRKRMHIELRENLSRLGANLKQSLIESARKTWESIHEFARAHSTPASTEQDTVVEEASEAEEESSQEPSVNLVQVGRLNGGQRIDYVLQEKPIESLNEYLFALSSHVCYWVSEDTALFMLKEIYRK